MIDIFDYHPKSNVRVMREDTGEILFEGHNVIVNSVSWLFARMMANININDPNVPYTLGHEVLYPVWGLALGSGSPSWPSDSTPPTETSSQSYLITEFLRKPLSRINYTDSSYNPVSTLSTYVDFQTVVNATTDNITQPIREMGLIGGGTFNSNTDMTTAPYFGGDPTTNVTSDQNSVILINYKTLPALTLPPDVNIIFSWALSF